MNSKLEILSEIAHQVEELQNNCDHNWGEIKRDTETEEIYEDRIIAGDVYSYPTGRYFIKECWSCECKRCSLKLYDEGKVNLEKRTKKLSKRLK